MNESASNNELDIFKARGLHFIQINMNTLLHKIEELRRIACLSNAAVIGISESKLDRSVRFSIRNYELFYVIIDQQFPSF